MHGEHIVKLKTGVLITFDAIKYKEWELAKSHDVASFQDQHGLVCMYDLQEWILYL
jgi:hypothetical protein